VPFDYYNIEDDVVTKIAEGFTASSLDIDTVPLPEDEDEVVKAIVKPRITVAFVSSKVGKPQSTNEQSYEEDITLLINVQAKRLRAETGCHTLARLIKNFIIGYQPSHCGRIYFKGYAGSEPVRNPDDKLWYWDLEFGVKKITVQMVNDDEPDGALFETISGNESIPCS